jgi:hypothetical protein
MIVTCDDRAAVATAYGEKQPPLEESPRLFR